MKHIKWKKDFKSGPSKKLPQCQNSQQLDFFFVEAIFDIIEGEKKKEKTQTVVF